MGCWHARPAHAALTSRDLMAFDADVACVVCDYHAHRLVRAAMLSLHLVSMVRAPCCVQGKSII